MRLVLIFMLSLCASCALPTIHEVNNSDQYFDFMCLSPNEEMIIYRAYDTCPTFSNKPEPVDKYWEIVSIDATSSSDYDNELKFRDKALSKNKDCTKPTKVIISYFLNKNDRLLVDRVVERADTISSKRLFLYGELDKIDELPLQSQSWTIDIRSNSDLETRERILTVFSKCATLK